MLWGIGRVLKEEYEVSNLRNRALIETLLNIRQLLVKLVVNTESGATAESIRNIAKNKG